MPADLLSAARRTIKEYRLRQDSRDPRVVNFPAAGLLDLHRVAAMAAESSISQVLPFDPRNWDAEGFEHSIWREAARSGLAVHRIYVLPHRGVAQEALDRQLHLDARSAVDARVVRLSDIPESERADIPNGMWLIDDQTVVISRAPSPPMEPVWAISQREVDLDQARYLWRQMGQWTAQSEMDVGGIDLEEPLVLSADLMHGVAPVLCNGDHVDRRSCAWYHGSWQYLRLMNLVSTPTWHSEFYSRELAGALRNRPRPRSLITGTADYSLLAYLLAADPTRTGQVDVLDLCATPLFACRWYAKRVNRRVGLIEADLFDWSSPVETYDLIASDAFLTRFSSAEVEQVASTWATLLRPGGRVITTVRVHPRSEQLRDAVSAIRDFRERAELRVQRWRAFLARSPAEVGRIAEAYAETMRSSDIGDTDDICSLLTAAGLAVRFEELAKVPGELQPTTYMRLVCEVPNR